MRGIVTTGCAVVLMAVVAMFATGESQGRESASYEIPSDALDCSGGGIASSSFSIFYTCSESPTIGYSDSSDFQLYAGFVPKYYHVLSGDTRSEGDVAPRTLKLNPGRPNPFSGSTRISYAVPSTGYVRLAIYDVAGREIRRICDGVREPGIYVAAWNGRSADGQQMSPGVYISMLEASRQRKIQKLVLVR